MLLVISDRLTGYRDRVRRELTRAFRDDHTPREVAFSFAIGIFVTAMPTGGLGIGLFFLFVYWWSWVSKTAIFASVVVLNPFVKPLVYVASYKLGSILIGAEPLVLIGNSTADYVLVVVQLLLIGNVLIALFLSAVSYVLVLYLTRSYRRRFGDQSLASVDAASLSVFPWRR